MKTKKYENKVFLKRLSEHQLKELIILCGKAENLAEFERIQSLDDINLQLPDLKEEWDLGNYLYINAYIGKIFPLFEAYELNDFEMKECTGYYKKEYDELLRKYLTRQFGEEYIEYLLNKRVCDAMEEKQKLISYYHDLDRESKVGKNVLKKQLH